MGELKEHGFRFTVRDGSLPGPTAPITGAEDAVVLKCEAYSNRFLATCKLSACGDPVFGEASPHGIYMVQDAANTISKIFQACKNIRLWRVR